MNKYSLISQLLHPGVIGIIRSNSGAKLVDATKALVAGGLTAIEITMTTPGALSAIRDAKRAVGDTVVLGAGTVLDSETARSVIFAGAEFIVTPVFVPSVIQMARRNGVPVICGAMTPTEAYAAFEAGADFIKLFPAEKLGPEFVKALLAPLPMLEVIPTGGVTPDNIPAYFTAGAVAVGAGGQLVSQELIDNGDFSKITKNAGRYVAAAKKARGVTVPPSSV